MNRLKKAMETIEREMTAAAFAEAGEAASARELLGERKRVLVVLTGQGADRRSLKYAIGFCTRMGAALEILCSTRSRKGLEEFIGELRDQDITYSIHETDQCLKQAVIEVTRKTREIHHVVINSYDGLEKGCERDPEVPPDMWRFLSCPLVVVGA
jgi:hypothetical protein